jgi:carbonic anhydrase/acetyltransferase-like protein (isoleucine patch superfamily)
MLFALPWRWRRRVLELVFHYEIDPTARIGFSIVLAGEVRLAPGARIGHLTLCRGLDRVVLAEHAGIGHLNWIYAISPDLGYFGEASRSAELILERAANITRRHIIDCSDQVQLGAFALVAGYRSQILTHSVSLNRGRQTVRPILIEDFSFVGTGCILLGGSRLPHHSALVAGSTLRHSYTVPYRVYGGVLATEVGTLAEDAYFFHRGLTESG